MKEVIFTVDVEGHVGADPVGKLIYGKIGEEKWGIDLLMDICDLYNVRGLFFVDIAEAFDYGEERIANVIRHIISRNHDVGVHIHPDHMADKSKLFLYDYGDDEQEEIIKKCTSFYESVVGKKPVAFRAGKYGANLKTIEIIKKYGYIADFSEYYGQRWCGINPPITGTQTVICSNGIIEIPTMSYRNSFPGLFDRFDKIDAGMPLSEYEYVMDKLSSDSYTNPIVLFAHSFSLMSWRSNPDNPKKNPKEKKKLKGMFELVEKDNRLCFSTLDEIVKESYSIESKVQYPLMDAAHSIYYMIPRAVKVLKMRMDIKKRDSK